MRRINWEDSLRILRILLIQNETCIKAYLGRILILRPINTKINMVESTPDSYRLMDYPLSKSSGNIKANPAYPWQWKPTIQPEEEIILNPDMITLKIRQSTKHEKPRHQFFKALFYSAKSEEVPLNPFLNPTLWKEQQISANLPGLSWTRSAEVFSNRITKKLD